MNAGRSFALLTTLRLAWRHAARRPLQSLFFVVGVAIGVAMIVAIDLANGSAERAFQLSAETVTGRATHQILGGPTGLDQGVYVQLRRDLGYRLSAPVVEEYVVVDELDRQPMRLLGIDPFADAPFRSYLGTGETTAGASSYLADLVARPDTVLLSTEVAERYGLQPGDALTAAIGGKSLSLEIIGLLEPADDLSRRALEGLLISDIATAQEVLGRLGRLDRIDLIVAEGPAGEQDLARIAALLPPGARLAATAARTGTVNEMTRAFSLNLTALSLLALVVGMFLIYNTVTFSVIQRRPVLGSLRALGMTRREIFAVILAEAGLLGLIGIAGGLGLGIVLGRGAVQAVTQTMNDLFFVVAVREVSVPPWTLIKAALIGLAAALVAAAVPAYEAASVPPIGALQRSHIEERARRAVPWVTAMAAVLLLLGVLLLVPEWNLAVAFAGLFAVIIGCALLTPLLTLVSMRGLQRLTASYAGVIGRMAPRYLVRSLSRISVAVAALMVAVSVIIGVGIMIGSFRATVELWLEDVLQADIFISPPSLIHSQASTDLDPAVIDAARAFAGVESLATTRGVDVAAFLEEGTRAVDVRLVALSDDIAGERRRYRAAVGDWRATWQAVEAGGVVINEPMANRYDLQVGDELVLQTDRGRRTFPIAGVGVDFDVNAVVVMADPIYRTFWEDSGVSAVGLFVAEGVDVDAKVLELRAALVDEAGVLIRSNRGTRENALAVFDRTFSITVALQFLATLVAFIGILSTLMGLQLERTREIGVLRSTGMTRRQLWRLSLLETGLIGAGAGLLAMPTGLALAAILIYIINLRSFGWTLTMQMQPAEFLQAFAVALSAALLAGLYPAWRMGRLQPAIALRAE